MCSDRISPATAAESMRAVSILKTHLRMRAVGSRWGHVDCLTDRQQAIYHTEHPNVLVFLQSSVFKMVCLTIACLGGCTRMS